MRRIFRYWNFLISIWLYLWMKFRCWVLDQVKWLIFKRVASFAESVLLAFRGRGRGEPHRGNLEYKKVLFIPWVLKQATLGTGHWIQMHVDTISTLLIYDSHSINLNNSTMWSQKWLQRSKVELNMDENLMKDIEKDMIMHEN